MAKDFLLAKMPAFHVKEFRTKVMFIFFVSFFFSFFIFLNYFLLFIFNFYFFFIY